MAIQEMGINEAVELLKAHDCSMKPSSLRAWCRSIISPCPFGKYITEDESNGRGKYVIFRNRLLTWVNCNDMRVAYGGLYIDKNQEQLE